MTRNRLSIPAVALIVVLGCSEEYGHERLDAGGPEAQRVKSMVSALRQAGPDSLGEVMNDQTAAQLTEDQLKGLRGALGRIVTADSVKLQKIEKFGQQVYRAVFDLETADGPATLAMLLAVGEDDTLKWLGKN